MQSIKFKQTPLGPEENKMTNKIKPSVSGKILHPQVQIIKTAKTFRALGNIAASHALHWRLETQSLGTAS